MRDGGGLGIHVFAHLRGYGQANLPEWAHPEVEATRRRYEGLSGKLHSSAMDGHSYSKIQGFCWKLVIVKGQRQSLLGLDWFPALGIKVTGVHRMDELAMAFDKLFEEFAVVFDGGLGCYKGPPVKLALNPEVVPVRLKARTVPFALRQKIDAELDKLLQQGVLEPVDCAEWETPIVTPLKGNGDVRICADYKCTINKALQQHAYPVPVVSHVLASLSGGTIFAKLDLAQAYQQLPVTDESAAAQTIVTHRGAFRVRRLQFGVSVAPGIFQNLMETLLRGIPGVIPYFDDVLIAGASGQELLSRLREVLRRFQDAGLKVKREKCQLGVAQVEFLGFRIDAEGIHPTPEKTQAILGAPRPSNKTELQAFLGLVNFYHAFLPHKATVAEPLHRLLDKKATFVWGQTQQRAFESVKELLASNQETRPEMPRAPVHPWEASRNPWSCLHMDFAGPFQGQTFLIVVDSYSKWLEVIPTSSMTSQTVIGALQKLFATHGLPDTIVSDNGAQFKSKSFESSWTAI
ncbi:hypothetical protein MRX96_040441 [Rhipicephalus microplus]